MTLQKLSDRFYYLTAYHITDRPILGYVRGDHHALMIDAGNSEEHVEIFLQALKDNNLPLPDYCVLTHWHWDHSFGLAGLHQQILEETGRPLTAFASTATQEMLEKVATWEWTPEARKARLASGEDIPFCDRCCALEYELDSDNPKVIHIDTADLTFDSTITLDLGGVHAQLTAMDSPHSRDAVLIEIPEESILFLGDASKVDLNDPPSQDPINIVGEYVPGILKPYLAYLKTRPVKTVFFSHGEGPDTMEYELGYLTEALEECTNLRIRYLTPEDIAPLAAGFLAQGWDDRTETLQGYYNDHQAGTRWAYVAEYCGEPVGYVTLIPYAKAGPFNGKYPEIVDFNVFERCQRKGIGTALLDAAEAQAAQISDVVTLGVGLYPGYGEAQRMYPQRGYVPDGSGIWSHYAVAEPYEDVCNDDGLVLYFSKKTNR